MRLTILGKLLAGLALSLMLGSVAYGQSWDYVPHFICTDAESLGVPQLVGTHGLDVNDAQILAANLLTGTVTFHRNPEATLLDRVVVIPSASRGTKGSPRGVIFNAGDPLTTPAQAGIIVCTYDGLICTWNPGTRFTRAFTRVNHASLQARYVALDMGRENEEPRVYVVNVSSRQIEAYNPQWTWLRSFRNDRLDPDYTPTTIWVEGESIYTGWVKAGQPSVVSVFNPSGLLICYFAIDRRPEGLTIAPPDFGDWSGALVVADGENVRAYDPATGDVLGMMREGDAESPPLWLDGINSLRSDRKNRIYFGMSIQSYQDGALGYVTAQR